MGCIDVRLQSVVINLHLISPFMWDCTPIIEVKMVEHFIILLKEVRFVFKLSLCLIPIGNVRFSGKVTLQVNSDLNGASPQFTLTCISTGGPATTVTWTRDSDSVITEGNETVLNDPVTAQYTHTLTVTERWPGRYKCTVHNDKPSTKSKVFTVKGICSH